MRVVIEHVNGILKSRFSCLRGIRTQIRKPKDLKIILDMIAAIFTLHNILIECNDVWALDDQLEDLFEDEISQADSSVEGRQLRERIKAVILNGE